MTSINDLMFQAIDANGSLNDKMRSYYAALAAGDPYSRDGAIAESWPRRSNGATHAAITANGTLVLIAIGLFEGMEVSSVTFASGSTALATGTAQWAALYSLDRAKLRVTEDRTNEAWSGSAEKTFTYTTPYTIPSTGLYYVGLMISATTHPTLEVMAGRAALWTGTKTPILLGASSTGLTDPASAPDTAGAITATSNTPYFYLS